MEPLPPIPAHPNQSQPIQARHNTAQPTLPILIPLKNSLTRSTSPSVLWNIFLTECILLMRAAFLKICTYAHMQCANVQYAICNMKYPNMIGCSDERGYNENNKIRK
jgi:hypothetical protein